MELIEKQGFKQSEIGLIPNDWKIEKFKNVTNAITCGVAATPTYVSESIGKPFLSASHVQNGKVTPINIKYITKDLYNQITKNNKPEKGDILYTRVGAGIGEAGVIDFDLDFAIYVSLTLIKPKSILFNYYLKSILNSNYYKFLAKNGQFAGGGVQNLNVEVVREFPIPIPPLEEQKAISNALSDVDDLITNLDKLISKKKAIKQGAMQQLLTPPHKGGKRLAGFSGEWEEKKLGEVVEYKNGAAHENCVVEDGDYIIVNSKFVSTEGKVVKYSNENRCPVNKDEILMVLSDVPNGKAIAKCYYVEVDNKYTLNQRICSFKTDKVDTKYLFLILNRNPYYLQFDDGVKQTNLRNEDVLKCPLDLPPTKEEQKIIAQILTDMDNEIQQLENKKLKYQYVKQGMMQELLTGKTRLV